MSLLASMSVHLDELRGRFIKVLIVYVVASCFFYRFVDPVFAYMIKPVGRLVFTSPADGFKAMFGLAMFGGFILSLPFTLYHIWSFAAQGLTDREKRFIRYYGPLSFVFFIGGGVFAYYAVIPLAMQFLLGFSSDVLIPMITVDRYISFVLCMVVSFGVVFEMPLVLAFLVKIGIATPEFLRQKRAVAVVLILVVSAFVTPPDIVTQLCMAVPLIVLYELGLVMARMVYKEKSEVKA